jgi:hypothetical protein
VSEETVQEVIARVQREHKHARPTMPRLPEAPYPEPDEDDIAQVYPPADKQIRTVS